MSQTIGQVGRAFTPRFLFKLNSDVGPTKESVELRAPFCLLKRLLVCFGPEIRCERARKLSSTRRKSHIQVERIRLVFVKVGQHSQVMLASNLLTQLFKRLAKKIEIESSKVENRNSEVLAWPA